MATVVAHEPTVPNGLTDPEKAAEELSSAMDQAKLEDNPEEPALASSKILNLPRTAADGVIKTPLAEPLETSKPPSRAPLTAEQEYPRLRQKAREAQL